MHRENPHVGVWFVLGVALLWETAGTAQAFAPPGFDTKVIGEFRLLVGAIALLTLAIHRKGVSWLASGRNARPWRIISRHAILRC